MTVLLCGYWSNGQEGASMCKLWLPLDVPITYIVFEFKPIGVQVLRSDDTMLQKYKHFRQGGKCLDEKLHLEGHLGFEPVQIMYTNLYSTLQGREDPTTGPLELLLAK